jgi:cobalt/nickel transport system permease protein
MGRRSLDSYSRLDSPIHRLPAGPKLTAALVLVLAILAVPRSAPLALGGIAATLAAVAQLSRIPWRYLLRRMLLLEPFVLSVALMALFQPDGWKVFLILVVKSTLSLFAMVLLSSTTPFSDLLRALKAARVPSLLVTTLSLMYRYLSVAVDEAQRMRRARAARTFTPHKAREWRALATVVGQLFIRASERADRIYRAMCARGWR